MWMVTDGVSVWCCVGWIRHCGRGLVWSSTGNISKISLRIITRELLMPRHLTLAVLFTRAEIIQKCYLLSAVLFLFQHIMFYWPQMTTAICSSGFFFYKEGDGPENQYTFELIYFSWWASVFGFILFFCSNYIKWTSLVGKMKLSTCLLEILPPSLLVQALTH